MVSRNYKTLQRLPENTRHSSDTITILHGSECTHSLRLLHSNTFESQNETRAIVTGSNPQVPPNSREENNPNPFKYTVMNESNAIEIENTPIPSVSEKEFKQYAKRKQRGRDNSVQPGGIPSCHLCAFVFRIVRLYFKCRCEFHFRLLFGSIRRVLYRRLFVIRFVGTFILFFPSRKFPTC